MNCAKIQHFSLASHKAYAGPFRMTTELEGTVAFPGDSRLNARVLAVGRWLLAVGCWPLAVGYWLLAVGRWLLVFGCL